MKGKIGSRQCMFVWLQLLHESFKKEWAPTWFPFSMSPKKNIYFFCSEGKAANTSTIFKDVSHVFHHEMLGRLIYSYLLLHFTEHAQKYQQREQTNGCMKGCSGYLQFCSDYPPFSYHLQSDHGTFLSLSFTRFKLFRTWCSSSC